MGLWRRALGLRGNPVGPERQSEHAKQAPQEMQTSQLNTAMARFQAIKAAVVETVPPRSGLSSVGAIPDGAVDTRQRDHVGAPVIYQPRHLERPHMPFR